VTSYIVLKAHVDGGGGWHEIPGTVAAPSAEAAIRKALGAKADATGPYVAVPARSWKPVKVSAVQTTVLKLENADPS
jgi:hypothetical protein